MKKNAPKIFIHVGMAKALSTSLRNDFFQKLPNTILIYGKFNSENPIHNLVQFLSIAQEKFRSKISLEKIKKDKKFENIKKQISFFLKKNKKNIIISWPSFIGSMGGARDDFNNLKVNAKLLKEIFGKSAKIILIIRRQDNYCYSLFSTVVKRGSDLTFDKFLTFKKKNISTIKNQLNIKPIKINYQRFYEVYINFFSKKNILILPYEQFLYTREIFENKLSKFLEQKKIYKLNVHHNKSLSFIGLGYMQKINSLVIIIRSILNCLDKIFNLKFKSKLRFLNEKYKLLRKFQKCLIFLDQIISIFYKNPDKSKSIQVEKFKKKILYECNDLNKKFDKKYKLNLDKYGYY